MTDQLPITNGQLAGLRRTIRAGRLFGPDQLARINMEIRRQEAGGNPLVPERQAQFEEIRAVMERQRAQPPRPAPVRQRPVQQQTDSLTGRELGGIRRSINAGRELNPTQIQRLRREFERQLSGGDRLELRLQSRFVDALQEGDPEAFKQLMNFERAKSRESQEILEAQRQQRLAERRGEIPPPLPERPSRRVTQPPRPVRPKRGIKESIVTAKTITLEQFELALSRLKKFGGTGLQKGDRKILKLGREGFPELEPTIEDTFKKRK